MSIRQAKGVIYFVFFFLMGLTILYDSYTTETLSRVLVVFDNVFGAKVFGSSFILASFVNLFAGWTGRSWQLIGFAPFLIYGFGVIHITYTTGAITIFGNLVFAFLVTILLLDWFFDTGLVEWLKDVFPDNN